MSVFVVPPLEEEPWPTLGPQVCAFIEDFMVHGPGDIRGEAAMIDDETRGLIYRMYEVYPQGHENVGRRRFKRVGISVRKGTAKTEKGAWLAGTELHPDGPVRCDGFDANGDPVGVGVRDPYIPLVAYTEEQTEELGYGALYAILAECPLADDFDIGLERITRADGTGRAVALAGAPNARDGARTTFQWFDESHRMTLPRLVNAHTTMLANIPKRKGSDPWTLETTTAFTPGENSIAEGTWDYARKVGKGEVDDTRLFFFHRQASDDHDLSTEDGLRAAVVEASGPQAGWSDIDSIISLRQDPKCDLAYWERVWLNKPTQAARQMFSRAQWDSLEGKSAPEWKLTAIGVDGARFRDSLAVIEVDIPSGQMRKLGIWRRPDNAPHDYEHPLDQVDQVVAERMETRAVWKLYIDPQWIDALVTRWKKRYGDRKVVEWLTHRPRQTAIAIQNFASAIRGGDVTHDGDTELAEHIGNARRLETNFKDDNGQPLCLIEKERPDSPLKIDGAMAAVLAWEARSDALEAGAKPRSGRMMA